MRTCSSSFSSPKLFCCTRPGCNKKLSIFTNMKQTTEPIETHHDRSLASHGNASAGVLLETFLHRSARSNHSTNKVVMWILLHGNEDLSRALHGDGFEIGRRLETRVHLDRTLDQGMTFMQESVSCSLFTSVYTFAILVVYGRWRRRAIPL